MDQSEGPDEEPADKLDVVGVVLAGGNSRRMGRDKATVPLGGRPMIEAVLASITAVCKDTIVIGRKVGWSEWPFVECTPDVEPGLGPLGGLRTAWRYITKEPLFVVGCDMPFLLPAAIRLVISRLEDADVAIPVVGGKPQPLHAAYAPCCGPVLEWQIRRGKLSMHEFIGDLVAHFISEDELRTVDPELKSVLSVNSPEDLRRACAEI